MTSGRIGQRYYFSEEGRHIAAMLDANDRWRPGVKPSDPDDDPMGPPNPPKRVLWRSFAWNERQQKEYYRLRFAAQDRAMGRVTNGGR